MKTPLDLQAYQDAEAYAIKYFYRLNLRRELLSTKRCLLYVPPRNVQYQKAPNVQIRRHATSKPSNIHAD